MESVNLSFLRRTLHTAHDRIHMLLLPQFLYKIGLSDRGFGCSGLSFDCQTNVLRMSRTQGSVTYSFFRESTPTRTSVSSHLSCADCSKTVSSRASCISSEKPVFVVQPRLAQKANASCSVSSALSVQRSA